MVVLTCQFQARQVTCRSPTRVKHWPMLTLVSLDLNLHLVVTRLKSVLHLYRRPELCLKLMRMMIVIKRSNLRIIYKNGSHSGSLMLGEPSCLLRLKRLKVVHLNYFLLKISRFQSGSPVLLVRRYLLHQNLLCCKLIEYCNLRNHHRHNHNQSRVKVVSRFLSCRLRDQSRL